MKNSRSGEVGNLHKNKDSCFKTDPADHCEGAHANALWCNAAANAAAAVCVIRVALTTLLEAIKSGDEVAAVAMIEKMPKLVWTKDDEGTQGYPAHYAAWYGRPQVLAALISVGGKAFALSSRYLGEAVGMEVARS
jgi:hypothetical protein